MGYRDRTVTIDFPELGDDITLTMKNPLLLPPEKLAPRDIPLDANGQPLDRKQAEQAGYALMASLIVSWNMYDPEAEGDVLLGDPTEETVARLPVAILNALADELGKALPQA